MLKGSWGNLFGFKCFSGCFPFPPNTCKDFSCFINPANCSNCFPYLMDGAVPLCNETCVQPDCPRYCYKHQKLCTEVCGNINSCGQDGCQPGFLNPCKPENATRFCFRDLKEVYTGPPPPPPPPSPQPQPTQGPWVPTQPQPSTQPQPPSSPLPPLPPPSSHDHSHTLVYTLAGLSLGAFVLILIFYLIYLASRPKKVIVRSARGSDQSGIIETTSSGRSVRSKRKSRRR